MIGEMQTPHSEQAVAVPAPYLSDAARLSPRHFLFPGSIAEIQLSCCWEIWCRQGITTTFGPWQKICGGRKVDASCGVW